MTQEWVDKLNTAWPLFGLTITTPSLSLRVLWDNIILMELATIARSIQASGEPQFQMSWMYDSSPEMERQFLQHYWRGLTNWKPENWHLRFVVFLDERPIGMQDIWAQDYAVARSVETGSWVTLEHQGRGYGTEMRAGVLELAFGSLSAVEACTDYMDGNSGSMRVSQKLGYVDNGQRAVAKGNKQATKHYMRLDREGWGRHRIPNVVVDGVEPCLDLFAVQRGQGVLQ